MIWLIRLYLLFMGVTYLLIGVWATLDPILISQMLELFHLFKTAVGLRV